MQRPLSSQKTTPIPELSYLVSDLLADIWLNGSLTKCESSGIRWGLLSGFSSTTAAAMLQAAGCVLQSCRLQVCRLQVAGCTGLSVGTHSAHSGSCKAAGGRVQGCRQQVAHGKGAGCRLQGAKHDCAQPAQRQHSRSGENALLLAVAFETRYTSHAPAFATTET